MPFSVSPEEAWDPLPRDNWNVEAAHHLLRRSGWTATPEQAEEAWHAGLDATLHKLFPDTPGSLEKPRSVARLEEVAPELLRETRASSGDERRALERELRERGRLAMQDLSLKWLAHAAIPSQSAITKWTLFLSDVYVVSAEKVRNPSLVFQHFDILLRHGLGPAPALTKAVSRSPAMVIYLDLNQSQRRAPNENFARELFELFVLGEGNYTEADIKEAARAFTGYRAAPEALEFRFAPNQHDAAAKTVFGRSGNFSGDDIIDLAYAQPAAARFLPQEMARFYLSDQRLPGEYVEPLARDWREQGFELRWLVHRFFRSKLFYAAEFRGNFIKSPLQFFLGLVQDLKLDVAPLPRMTLEPLRQMGQLPFYPPNVRGWIGGRNWINSATITARRQFVESLFSPLNEKALNGDELIDLTAARSNGLVRFTVDDRLFEALAMLSPTEAGARIAGMFVGPDRDSSRDVSAYLQAASADAANRLKKLRRATATLLQSPAYQVC